MLPKGGKWVLTEVDTHSGLGSAYLVVKTNAQNIIKELGQKIVYQFGLLSHIFSDQGSHFTDYTIQQWAERNLVWNSRLVEN